MAHNADLISPQGLRLDGRRQGELRHIKCSMNVLKKVDGSAAITHGNTKILASVSGPKHPTKRGKDDTFHFNVKVKLATFAKNGERLKVQKNSRKLNEFELNVKNIFKSVILVDKYERSQIDLNIEVLQTDGGGGSEFCTAVNASTLALIDAGICLKEYICACSASLTGDGVALMDVSHLEEISGGPTLTIAALSKSSSADGDEKKVAFVEMSQKFYLQDLQKIFDCALLGCEKLQIILDNAVRENANVTAIPELLES